MLKERHKYAIKLKAQVDTDDVITCSQRVLNRRQSDNAFAASTDFITEAERQADRGATTRSFENIEKTDKITEFPKTRS